MKNKFGLTPVGHEPDVGNIFNMRRSGGCSTDVAWVEMARAHGKKRDEMAEYLTWLTATPWDQQRVKIAWATLRKNKGKLRASAVPAEPWKSRSNKGTTYRQKVSMELKWATKWIYVHSLQGRALEIDREVMLKERYN
jgi:hypothetical protein